MKNYKIAVIPGDGTGPEVVNEALKVLDAAGFIKLNALRLRVLARSKQKRY